MFMSNIFHLFIRCNVEYIDNTSQMQRKLVTHYGKYASVFEDVYVISLESRIKYVHDFMKQINLPYTIIPAVTQVQDKNALIKEGYITSNFSLPLTKVAVHMSQVNVWKKIATKTKNALYLILEDDLQLSDSVSFNTKIHNFINNLPKHKTSKPMMVFLGRCWDYYNSKNVVNSEIVMVNRPLCRHAYAINPLMAKQLLEKAWPLTNHAGDWTLRKVDLRHSYAPICNLIEQNRDKIKSENNNHFKQYVYGNEKGLCDKQLNLIVENKDKGSLSTKILKLLSQSAAFCYKQPLFSVTDKKIKTISDKHNYINPAPYYHPISNDTRMILVTDKHNKKWLDSHGQSWIYRDGVRIPGTLYADEEHERYDRTRLWFFMTNVTTLTLSWFLSDEPIEIKNKYVKRARDMVYHFYINNETRMNPNLEYAQYNGKGLGHSGVIEYKDVYFFMDILRLLEQSTFLTPDDVFELRKWFHEYSIWLKESPKAKRESKSFNNHGVFYYLQLLSIHSYTQTGGLCEYTSKIFELMRHGIMSSGDQPLEKKRSTSLHYFVFNYMAWLYIIKLLQHWKCFELKKEKMGENMKSLLYNAFTNILSLSLNKNETYKLYQGYSDIGSLWPYQQIDDFNYERLTIMIHMTGTFFGWKPNSDIWKLIPPRVFVLNQYDGMWKDDYHIHNAIVPWWNLVF